MAESGRRLATLAFNQLISDTATRLVRVLVAGADAPDYRAVADRIRDTAAAHKALFDPEDDKRKMMNYVRLFKAGMSVDRLRGLRAGRYTEDEKLGMVLWMVSAMNQVGPAFDTEVGRRLLFVTLLRIVMWGETEGLENTDPAKVMNDSIDMEFVVMASYFDEIMSRDNRVQRLDRQLRNVMNVMLSERMMKAAYETGFRVAP